MQNLTIFVSSGLSTCIKLGEVTSCFISRISGESIPSSGTRLGGSTQSKQTF